jgi:small subunit ribosomal protein S8
MSQTDPIAELLTRIRNAVGARYNQVEVANSRLRAAICQVLLSEGFLAGIERKGDGPKARLVLSLRYSATREPIIQGIERVSRPGIRRYAGARKIPRVSGGLGVHVVTTPLGVMTDRDARRKSVGGEVLFKVW